jgi:uncharacterized protein (DUF1800 family)
MASITYDQAAHLLRRMGFGGSPDDIAALAALDRQSAVNSLLDYAAIDNSVMENTLKVSFDFSNPNNPAKFNRGEIERWWLTRMVATRRPFEEKLTLFWHNHFATAASKVPEIFMFVQNQLLRANGLARFDDLLLQVARDPAMLIWLDGITNVKSQPNENFAREVQELFTMGIVDAVTGEQNYTEDDVKQIARAFTGWTFGQPDPSQPYNFITFVNPVAHDFGAKTIYGQTANYGGEDVTPIIAARRATARFLVKKLFQFFVYPLTSDSSDLATIEKFADVYMANNHSIREVVRAIFSSDEFFSDRAMFGLVKSPVELVIGAIRMIGARYNAGPPGSGSELAGFSSLLGQEVFNPPDVSGWPHGMGWINTATLLSRYLFADLLVITRPADPTAPGAFIDHDQLSKHTKGNTKKTVKNFLSLLGPLNLDNAAIGALRTYLQTDDQGNQATFAPDDLTIEKKIRGLVHQIMCLSEFQLN